MFISVQCFANNLLALPNPEVLSQNPSSPLNLMAPSITGGEIMPDGISVDISTGAVKAVSFQFYTHGVGIDEACAAIETHYSNRLIRLADKRRSKRFVLWQVLNMPFTISVYGSTNQANIIFQEQTHAELTGLQKSPPSLDILSDSSSFADGEYSKGVTIPKSNTNDQASTEQEAGVVRESRCGSRAPQP